MKPSLQSDPAKRTAAATKLAVRRYWDAKPCGVKNTTAPVGTEAFFAEVERHRYEEEFHIPDVAEFASHMGESVLEVGCGLGTDGRQFVRGGARYVGCELSVGSLRLAQQGFKLFGMLGTFICADAERLPFCNNCFDLVYSHGVLHHVPDTVQAVQELHRVLRPGGRAIAMLYARESLANVIGAQIIGRLRLEFTRLKMGRSAFNRFVGLNSEHRGWLPNWVVINNSTDGVGNPLSKLYNREELLGIFRNFRAVRLEKHYFPRRKIPILGRFIPRTLASYLGRLMGNFWYVKGTK